MIEINVCPVVLLVLSLVNCYLLIKVLTYKRPVNEISKKILELLDKHTWQVKNNSISYKNLMFDISPGDSLKMNGEYLWKKGIGRRNECLIRNKIAKIINDWYKMECLVEIEKCIK